MCDVPAPFFFFSLAQEMDKLLELADPDNKGIVTYDFLRKLPCAPYTGGSNERARGGSQRVCAGLACADASLRGFVRVDDGIAGAG